MSDIETTIQQSVGILGQLVNPSLYSNPGQHHEYYFSYSHGAEHQSQPYWVCWRAEWLFSLLSKYGSYI